VFNQKKRRIEELREGLEASGKLNGELLEYIYAHDLTFHPLLGDAHRLLHPEPQGEGT